VLALAQAGVDAVVLHPSDHHRADPIGFIDFAARRVSPLLR
jgi:hypothetical protein